MLAIASWQAFQSRAITSEFSEGVYIGLAVFSMAQAFLTGIPIVAVVREIPQAFYLVLTFLLFFLCMVILLLIFLPKVFMQRAYATLSPADQRKMMASSVRQSAQSSSAIFSARKEGDSSVQTFQVQGSAPEEFPRILENEQEAIVKEEGNNYEPKMNSSIIESTVSTASQSGGITEEESQPLENEQEEPRPKSIMESACADDDVIEA